MKALPQIKTVALALGYVMLLSGCQGAPTIKTTAPLDNAGFMTAWDVYRHCQAGTDDVDTMRTDMNQLARVAAVQESADTLSASLPDFVKRVMTKPASRLAADPKAMAAACALSAGQAALRIERMDVAAEMFRTVLQDHQQPEYAYYADQARAGMEAIARGVQAAAPTAAPMLIPISSTASAHRNSTPVSFTD
jgi:hypothetical protein